MGKCNVCSFLYPSNPNTDEIFERIINILQEHKQTIACYMLKDINIVGKNEDDILQEFMDKVTLGFKEEENV